VERAGNGAQGQGAITAIYTVLTEGDDQQDPIADAARAILDGHIVLSRRLAEAGHYPAIDVEASISRVMPQIISPEQLAYAQQFKRLYSLFVQNQDLINVGAYVPGSDPQIDEAVAMYPQLQQFLKQGMHEAVDWQASVDGLQTLMQQPMPRNGQQQPLVVNSF
jgi:flagellum-specific ATP synthase